jgi:hypothetical protein
MNSLSIGECINYSSQWLAEIQNKKDGGWGEYKGANSNSLNTAESILALIKTYYRTAGDKTIRDGVGYLINQQLAKRNHGIEEDYGAWAKSVTTRERKLLHIPDTIRTGLALLALNTAGESSDGIPISRGIKWLLRTQNDDGGWGYKSNHTSRLFPSCLALKALIRIYAAGDTKLEGTISKGLKHILKYRNDGGSFGNQVGLEVSHTLHVIHVLQLAVKQKLSNSDSDIREARDWIGQNRNRIAKWGAEIILIGDVDGSPYNYTFSHINPVLYLTMVDQYVDLQDEIARDALLVVHDNMDPITKGFCAKRSVSWATANTITGLVASKTAIQMFPDRKSTAKPYQYRHYAFYFLVLLTAISAVLAIMDKLTVTVASFFFAAILVALLIHGIISEKTWLAAISSKINFFKK